MIDVKHNL